MPRVVATLEAPLPAPRDVIGSRSIAPRSGKFGQPVEDSVSDLSNKFTVLANNGIVRDQTLLNFFKTLQKIYEQLARVINGRISFGDGLQRDNIAGEWASTTTPVSPDTEFSLTHNLGYVPQGWLTLNQNKAASLYSSGTPWTTTKIFLKCDVSTVAVKVFIL